MSSKNKYILAIVLHAIVAVVALLLAVYYGGHLIINRPPFDKYTIILLIGIIAFLIIFWRELKRLIYSYKEMKENSDDADNDGDEKDNDTAIDEDPEK